MNSEVNIDPIEHADVIVVGAGISGISAAYHLQTRTPDRQYVMLEGRERIGGTWDLFRYPGVRSDSDMHTLGFGFRPWVEAKAIADGSSILSYLEDTARAYRINERIRFGHCVRRAEWSTDQARWTLDVETPAGNKSMTCGFLFMCSGYFNYAQGYMPVFPGADDFAGCLVHPQSWPPDLDTRGKRVIVIGSGATAVTLVPALAATAAHVTMLQRSPSYVVALPAEDRLANLLRRFLPAGLGFAITRWRNIGLQMWLYAMARRSPKMMNKRLIALVRDELGADFDVETHFTPRYNVWDQRLCVVPDGDLFDVIRSGSASVVTDEVERLTPGGIALKSGRTIDADVIVSATGLELQLFGGLALSIDGTPVDLSRHFNYRGMMFSDVPNLAYSYGYTNASWTLKADLTSAYVCRLLRVMAKRGLRQVTPRLGSAVLSPQPFLDFSSGYVRRMIDRFPKQGDRSPWKLHQNYARDLLSLRYGSIDRSVEFGNPG